RWRGLIVEKFAIWFGKPIWSRRINGVEYRLGSIPAGGYVAIPQLAPMEALEGRVETDRSQLPAVRPLDKIIVAAAGPAFSLGLALLMAVIVWFVGKPESESDSTVVGYVKPGGPAETAGLRVGDRILAVDGQPVHRFMGGTDGVKWRVIRSEGDRIAFRVDRQGEILTINSGWTKPITSSWRRPALREVQIGPRIVPGIGFVMRGSVADKAGLQPNDLIVAANGTPIFNLDEMVPVLKENAGKSIALTVNRNGQMLPVSLAVPGATTENAPMDLGIDWGRVVLSHPTPWSQVKDAATSIFRMVGALLSPKSDVKAAHFSGPVGIMRLYYQVFETSYGWQLALSLSVLINVNLAILNLLPFPVLDGGHIVLAIIEGIRRKPINVRVLEAVQTACAVLLIGFMLYVTFFDVGDIFATRQKEAPEQTK
ncbi:MAG TPA: RIP metalloprotease RseP, partial [Terrimicrobiaceae bacterium]|nr:RIP metalloprotease RseP [Terrimicrobiaceae bacterium]